LPVAISQRFPSGARQLAGESTFSSGVDAVRKASATTLCAMPDCASSGSTSIVSSGSRSCCTTGFVTLPVVEQATRQDAKASVTNRSDMISPGSA